MEPQVTAALLVLALAAPVWLPGLAALAASGVRLTVGRRQLRETRAAGRASEELAHLYALLREDPRCLKAPLVRVLLLRVHEYVRSPASRRQAARIARISLLAAARSRTEQTDSRIGDARAAAHKSRQVNAFYYHTYQLVVFLAEQYASPVVRRRIRRAAEILAQRGSSEQEQQRFWALMLRTSLAAALI